MACEQDYWNQMYANACDQNVPSLLWRPQIFIDGNKWCALYGDNVQDGVAGFGDTPEMAMRDFDLNWCEQKISTGRGQQPKPTKRSEHMEELLRNIKGEMEVFKFEADKAVRGNNAASLRSRKASRSIDKLLKQWRTRCR